MATIRVTNLTDEEQAALRALTEAHNAQVSAESAPLTKTEYAEWEFAALMGRWVALHVEAARDSVRDAYKAAAPEVRAQVDALLGR